MLDDPLKLLGQSLRRTREQLGLSQEAVGAAADLHRNEVGAAERGEKNISFINLLRLCSALRTTPSELLGAFTLTRIRRLPPKRASPRRREK